MTSITDILPVKLFTPTVLSPVSLKQLNDYLTSNQHFQILNDPELFWQLFCREFANSDKSRWNAEMRSAMQNEFDVQLVSSDQLIVNGHTAKIAEISQYVDRVRKACCKSIQNNNSVCHLIFDVRYTEYVKLILNLNTFLNSDQGLKAELFRWCISPSIESIFKSLNCKVEEKNRDITCELNGKVTITETTNDSKLCFIIYWGKTIPIFPSKVLEKEIPFDEFCSILRQKGENCDMKLISADGTEFPIHQLMLRYRGGEELGKRIEKQTLHLDYSKGTLQALIDFLYKGPNSFIKKYQLDKDLDIKQLGRLAQEFNIERLIHCCLEITRLSPENEEVYKQIRPLIDLAYTKV